MDYTSRTGTGLLIESVMVIASILIAFAIDAWWDRPADREAELASTS